MKPNHSVVNVRNCFTAAPATLLNKQNSINIYILNLIL